MAALDDGDVTGARRAAQLVDPTGLDDLLLVLATRASTGSVAATEVLLVELDESGMVRRFARGALLDEMAVDDVCQDSLISIAASVGVLSRGLKGEHVGAQHRASPGGGPPAAPACHVATA